MNSPSQEPSDRPGTAEVPDFDLIRLIGEGAFGTVWLASNQTTGRLRAVKVIPLRSASAGSPARREIVSLKHLEAHIEDQHPNSADDPSRGQDGRALVLRDGLGGRRIRGGGFRGCELPAGHAGAATGGRALARRRVPRARPAASGRTGRAAPGRNGPPRREAGQLPVRRRPVEGGGLRAVDRGRAAGVPPWDPALHAARRPDGRQGRRVRGRTGDLPNADRPAGGEFSQFGGAGPGDRRQSTSAEAQPSEPPRRPARSGEAISRRGRDACGVGGIGVAAASVGAADSWFGLRALSWRQSSLPRCFGTRCPGGKRASWKPQRHRRWR